MKKLVIAVGFATISASVLAAPMTFEMDPSHTVARFEYNHFGYSNQIQRFDKTSGKVVLDRAAKKASVDVTIDAKSVNTGVPLLNEHIQGPDFFDTAKYPTITFKSTKVTFNGDKPATVEGNLTVKGITKPVTLTITSFQEMPHPMMKKEAIGANAIAKVKRSEFNMGKYTPNVSDDITLSIAVEALAH